MRRFVIAARLATVALSAAAVLAGLPGAAQTQADPEAAGAIEPRPLVTAEAAMVVAAHPLAVAAGVAMLDEGGSAVDAAIATLLVLNVVEPQSSGIGGGAFAVLAGAPGAAGGVTSWDGRETAPAGALPDMFTEAGEPLPFLTAVASGRSVGVPGLVALMAALHERHGKLEWASLFEPAIELADGGFAVSARLAESIAAMSARLEDTAAALVFLPGGVPLAEGEELRQGALARTLRTIAEGGPEAFYGGLIAEEIVHAVAREPRPGTMTAEDIAGYRAVERPAACHEFAGQTVCGMGPPSSGATTVGQILMLMEAAGADGLAADDPRLWHLFAEASRLAYADRAAFLADPDFVQVPVKGLLDAGYVAGRAALIPGDTASTAPAEPGEPPYREGRLHAPDGVRDRPGTTHVSVLDADGLAVSVTASIETSFGSGRMAAGFLLNNQLTDFSFLPAAEDGTPIANRVEPGKRPRSSMAPTVVLDGGRPVLVTGSPGGSRIPEYVAQTLVAVLLSGLDPAEASALAHVSQRNTGVVSVEPGIAPTIPEGLAALGHAVDEVDMTSGLHTIRVLPDGTVQGGADPRREGVALGR